MTTSMLAHHRLTRRIALLGLLPLLITLGACADSVSAPENALQPTASALAAENSSQATDRAAVAKTASQPIERATMAEVAPQPSARAVAIFAGGCFWCMEPPFDKLPGVISTTSGYTGGHVADPTYEQVSAGGTGHAEAVQVNYDPSQVSYAKLLEVFWHNIDPVAVDRQFCDVGEQYRSAIFTIGEQQQRLAEASKRKWQVSDRFERPIATEIVAATTFYPAENYHQDYYKKNPVRYKFYRWNCGRDQRLDELWGAND